MKAVLKIRVLAIVLLLSLATVSYSQESRVLEAAALIEEFMADTKAPGVAVSVGLNGRIVWSEGFGYADVEQRVPVWPGITLFRVGSVAKPMTAVAVGQLYEQGRLDLDAPVQDYVPSFPEKERPITTRQLAGHLAGIRHYEGKEFLSQKPYPTVLEGLAIFQDDPLVGPPGDQHSYSTYGWNLISAVVEGASGQEFLSYMDEHVFSPIGMNHTHADFVDGIIQNRGRYYVVEEDTVLNASPVDNSYKWAGGGFLSTSDDLVRFAFAHLDPAVLKPETVELMWTSQKTTSGEETGYGIGWRTETDRQGRHWVGHGGGSVGGSTRLRIVRDAGVVVVIIANISDASYGDLADKIAKLFVD